ncbi:induced myeloid leukemia cell differentiation protein Mcl-1-like [Stegostoma tigrinum]|uniref:induced myeloid leukemia cell differentiation protein Mcl-1-like n=1 Tax=Stegostoma tigrinum TaxID=3053191 RepID=UPI00202B2742|nr:induced myeloid leukemia cell differentiation protein Mcl-1-like [Stegostoma tigrinum]
MEQTMLALNRSSNSALLQLHTNLYCTPASRAACSPPRLLPGAADGSLPQTPDGGASPVEDELGSRHLFPEDPFYGRTYTLVRGFIRWHVKPQQEAATTTTPPLSPGGGPSWLGCLRDGGDDDRQAIETLRRIGDRLIEKHGTAFRGMINRLNISEKRDLDTISRVATEMFSDGEVNWGRVVSFIAFGAVMGDHLKKIQREDCIDEVAVRISQYLTQHKRGWLETHNGWDGFTKFFHENNAEESAKKALMWIAGFGIAGASIMHLLR